MRTILLLVGVALGAIAALSFLLWMTTPALQNEQAPLVQTAIGTATNPKPPPAPLRARHDSAQVDTGNDKVFITGLENRPASLIGTEPDGEWQQDGRGNLIISKTILHIFDYFLSALGEETMRNVIARIHANIDYQLTEPAASEAKELLNNYLAMKTQLSRVNSDTVSPPDTPDLIRYRLQQISDLRKSYLSPEVADAFYGDEETLDRFTLDKITIQSNELLTAAEKQTQIAALESQLPETIQGSMDKDRMVAKLNQLTQELVKAGGSAEDIRSLRSQMVGDDAAERLQELDRRRMRWKSNLQSWFNSREDLANNPQLSAMDKEQQISQLRTQYFAAEEIQRVIALERIHDGNR